MRPQARLQLRLLGRPKLLLADRDLSTATGDKALALLAYLALAAPTPVTRERLAGLFWPDKTEETARYRLRHTLWKLRGALGKSHLHADDSVCWLALDRDIWVDVLEFQAGCQAVGIQSHPHSRSTSASAMVRDKNKPDDPDSLQALADLYAGDFLEGLTVYEAPLFDEWLLVERERLNLLYQDVLWYLAQAQIATNNTQDATTTLNRLIQVDPLREQSYRALIRLHLHQGNRAAALQVYQRCVDILATELGIPPSPETERLYPLITQHSSPSTRLMLEQANRLLQEKRYAEAMAICATAESLDNDPITASTITVLRAEIALARGQQAEALKLIQKAGQTLQQIANGR